MVHVAICPLGKFKRGRTCRQFIKDGKPQFYCYGVIDCMTDDFEPECKRCADWYDGEQCEKDFQEWLQSDGKNGKDGALK